MGYLTDIHRVFIFEFDENQIVPKDRIQLDDNFKKLEFWDKTYSYCYDFRFVPTYNLLDLRHRIPSLNQVKNETASAELKLTDFMTIDQIELLQYFEYGEQKIYGVVNQIKTHQISDYWEFASFCSPIDLLRVATNLLEFAKKNVDFPILTTLEIWDNLEERDRSLLIEELKQIILFCQIAERNNFNLLMMSTSD